MLTKVVIAGFGGQGALLMGYCLATAAMQQDFHTTFLPSYGPEVRGGTANCTVAVSDQEIASPVASEPEYVIALNNPSLLRFQNHVIKGGTLFLNSDMVDIEPARDDLRVVRVPAVSLANSIGNPRGMNVVMLGVFNKQTELVDCAILEQVITRQFAERGEKLVELNLKALRLGYAFEVK